MRDFNQNMSESAPEFQHAELPIQHMLNALESLECQYNTHRQNKQFSSKETKLFLQRLQQIHEDLQSFSSGQCDKALFTALTRLSADISNHLMDQLVDTVVEKQHSIDFLQQELSRKLREQHIASQLLQQAQQIRIQTQECGESVELGSVL